MSIIGRKFIANISEGNSNVMHVVEIIDSVNGNKHHPSFYIAEVIKDCEIDDMMVDVKVPAVGDIVRVDYYKIKKSYKDVY